MRTQNLSKTGAGTQWQFVGSRGLNGEKDRCVSYTARAAGETFPLQLPAKWGAHVPPISALRSPGIVLDRPRSLRPHTGRVSTAASWGKRCWHVVPAHLEAATRVLRSPPHHTLPALWVYASTAPWGNFHFCPVADFSTSH